MVDKKNDLGHIQVEMGDGNIVEHIGHKITYETPPPPPNAIFQNGVAVGQFDGQPRESGGQYVFPRLTFVGSAGDASAEFTIQGVRLRLLSYGSNGSVSFPGYAAKSFDYAACEVLGST
jgi:hypothetical protein